MLDVPSQCGDDFNLHLLVISVREEGVGVIQAHVSSQGQFFDANTCPCGLWVGHNLEVLGLSLVWNVTAKPGDVAQALFMAA